MPEFTIIIVVVKVIISVSFRAPKRTQKEAQKEPEKQPKRPKSLIFPLYIEWSPEGYKLLKRIILSKVRYRHSS
tara:strand:+ start:102 stop:323 length:222 start_codon:yes stop_codon:yes gene_type:complete